MSTEAPKVEKKKRPSLLPDMKKDIETFSAERLSWVDISQNTNKVVEEAKVHANIKKGVELHPTKTISTGNVVIQHDAVLKQVKRPSVLKHVDPPVEKKMVVVTEEEE